MQENLDQRSNIALKSNVMVEGLKPFIQSCPGDLAYLLHPSLFDLRTQHQHFSEKQIQEYQQTLVCFLCHRPCAGTCQSDNQ